MERKERRYVGYNELPEDPCDDMRQCGAGNSLFYKELKAYKRLFEKDEAMDDSYKILLACLLVSAERFEPQSKQIGRENADEPLLQCPVKGGRSEPCMKVEDKDRWIQHNGVRENVVKGSEKRFQPREDRKGKGSLIEHEVVRQNAGKALEERFRPAQKQKGNDRLVEHYGVCENAGEALGERFETPKKLKGAGKALEKRLELHKKGKGKDHLSEHQDVCRNAGKASGQRPKQHKKREGKEDHLTEHDDVRENAGKALKERLVPHKNRKGEDRSIEHDGVYGKAEEDDDREYELFLKYLKDLGKSYAVEYKKDSINVVIKYRKNIGSDKPLEKSSRVMKRNPLLPNQVPIVDKPLENDQKDNSVKKARPVGKSSNEEEKVAIDNLSPSELRNIMRKLKNGDEKVEIEKCPVREFRSVVKKPRDEAEKVKAGKPPGRESRNVYGRREIETLYSPRELRNVVMRRLRNGDEKVEIENSYTPHVVMKKSRDKDEKVDIKKRSACDMRNVVMKKSKNEDEKVETEKCSARDFRNIMKESRNEVENVDLDQLPVRDFGNIPGANKSSRPHTNFNEDDAQEESEDYDVEILDMDAACLKGPFVSANKFGKIVEENGSRPNDSSDEFRREVMELLMKPFDKNEYIVLKTESEARHYTDYHPDLGRKLKKWRYNQRNAWPSYVDSSFGSRI